jgi:hypothetical protein
MNRRLLSVQKHVTDIGETVPAPDVRVADVYGTGIFH